MTATGMTTSHERSGGRTRGVIAGWVLIAAVATSDVGWAAGAGAGSDAAGTQAEGGASAVAEKPVKSERPEATAPAPERGVSAPDPRDATGETNTTNIVYVPPSRGQARHTAGAGTRGFSPNAGRGEARPRVAIVAPRDHVGLTTSASPTLYWHLSAPTTTRIELTVVDDEAIEPVVQIALPGPVAAGLHALELSKLGVTLAPDKTYRWFVALVHDAHRRSKDELAEGAVERVAADPRDAGAGAPTSSRPAPGTASALRSAAKRAARDGYWYDAFADLSTAIERDPADAGLVAERQALLEQARVGLELR